jgi:hypothetical protein
MKSKTRILVPTLAGASLLMSACAGSTDTTPSTTPTASSAAPSVAAPAQPPGTFTDAQLASFVAASREIAPISDSLTASSTAEQRSQATSQIRAILQRHNLSADTYNAIATRSRTDQALSNRIAGLTPANFTDAQLTAFVAAAAEIDPISRSLATATPEQRTQATEQIRAILTRHNIDSETYNAIAARAQTDAELAARITALQAPADAPQ